MPKYALPKLKQKWYNYNWPDNTNLESAMNIATVLILSLATWRLASLLYDEAGPWQLFNRVRGLFGIKHDDDGPVSYPSTFFGDVFQCFWCVSLYTAAMVIIFAATSMRLNWQEWILLWLATATGAIVIEQRFTRRYKR